MKKLNDTLNKLNDAIYSITGVIDMALMIYILWLQAKYLFAGDTTMFLFATIAGGVWSLSCTWMREAIKEGKSHE